MSLVSNLWDMRILNIYAKGGATFYVVQSPCSYVGNLTKIIV